MHMCTVRPHSPLGLWGSYNLWEEGGDAFAKTSVASVFAFLILVRTLCRISPYMRFPKLSNTQRQRRNWWSPRTGGEGGREALLQNLSYANLCSLLPLGEGRWQGDTTWEQSLVLSPPCQPGGPFAKVPCIYIKGRVHSVSHQIASEMLLTYVGRYTQKKSVCVIESHETCVSVLDLWFTSSGAIYLFRTRFPLCQITCLV